MKILIAAAVTVIVVTATGVIVHPDPILFAADHPFEFYICDGSNDNLILFHGKINNPGIPEGSVAVYNESNNPVWDRKGNAYSNNVISIFIVYSVITLVLCSVL